MDIKSYLTDTRQLIEEALAQYMLKPEGVLADHLAAMRYSLFVGGKRVRPILCVAAAEAMGAERKKALPVACALEYIHTYSLIHDDLPAMDNDDLRRGKPTNHKIFGEAAAILAGDGLLTLAFELLSDPGHEVGLSAKERLRIIHIIARASGPLGMVGGQALDLAAEGKETSLDKLKEIHSRKTGALITASVQSGAIIGRADERKFAALSEYGMLLGITFQIVDDILNITSTPEQLGKAVGSDAVRKKATYPAFLGLEESKTRAYETVNAAIAALADMGNEADHLRELAYYVLTRTK